MHVAASAFAALRDRRGIAGHHEVGEDFAGVLIEDDRSGRHSHNDVVGAVSVLFFAAAAFAVLGDQSRLVLEIEQRREAFVYDEDDAAATSAVAAGGAAEGSEF